MKKINLLYSVLIISLLTSCSIQKRHYRKGYNVQWNKNVNSINTAPPLVEDKMVVTASTNNQFIPLETKQKQILNSSAEPEVVQDSCDVLKLKNNKKLNVEIIEIGTSVISYKDCDNSDGKTKTIKKSKVAGITSKNGKEENLEVPAEVKTLEPKQQPTTNDNPRPKVLHSATSSLVFGHLAIIPVLGLIFSIMAMIYSLIAWIKIEKNSTKYRGKARAVAGGVLGLIGLIFFILIIAGLNASLSAI